MSDDAHTVELVVQDGVLVAGISGEIDLANADVLEAAVLAQVAASPAGTVVDLTAVTFIDSAGVRFLDHVVAALPAQHRLLVVAPEPGRARFTLRLCGFPDALLRAALADALAELREPPTP